MPRPRARRIAERDERKRDGEKRERIECRKNVMNHHHSINPRWLYIKGVKEMERSFHRVFGKHHRDDDEIESERRVGNSRWIEKKSPYIRSSLDYSSLAKQFKAIINFRFTPLSTAPYRLINFIDTQQGEKLCPGWMVGGGRIQASLHVTGSGSGCCRVGESAASRKKEFCIRFLLCRIFRERVEFLCVFSIVSLNKPLHLWGIQISNKPILALTHAGPARIWGGDLSTAYWLHRTKHTRWLGTIGK